ncbi:redoxin domain-containing protein [Prosthecobacter vanneervenii]|uniref:Thiol-disulfide isomerase/thioredoxin n=1 Tax=Prosthecobacter vanneervenii TaxID=48466 RepID=A0A7W7Y7C7_9BACT|nr:redoxin domain-containing protein [Prosthecobacter vanneervenii]MBB5030777.1 thiol-disulfide isomerase/thioredoxin [Prosthecobacter vanneervenii]
MFFHARLIAALFLLFSSFGSALDLPGTDGQIYNPMAAGSKKASVLFFVSPFCSTTKSFIKEINAIAADYGDKMAVYLVHSDPEVTKEVAMEHAILSEVKATVLLDKEQTLAKQVQAKITPEAVVIGPDGKTLYQGRINDLYLGPTKRQRAATTKDLRDALDAILSGKPVPAPQEPAQGCKIGGMK